MEIQLVSGCVVEYLQSNVCQIAYVMSVSDGKVRLLLPNKKETTMQANRLLPWFGPVLKNVRPDDRDGIISALQGHLALRKELCAGIDPLEMWALVREEMNTLSPKWLAELVFSDLHKDNYSDHVAACAQALLQCKTHFKFQNPFFEVYTEEKVELRLGEQRAASEREALVQSGKTVISTLLDIYHKRRPPLEEGEFSDIAPSVLQVIHEAIKKDLLSPDDPYSNPTWALISKAFAADQTLSYCLAVAWGIIEPHHNVELERIDYATGVAWADEFQAEINEIIENVHKALQDDVCLPLCELPFVSVDNATTKDVDDAFFVERKEDGSFHAHIALACPAFLWPFGGGLDGLVQSRASSVYLPEGTYHMMPEILGTNEYSLLAGALRPSLLVDLRVGADGKVLSCKPALVKVQLAANLHYDECEKALENPDNLPEHIAEHFSSLQAALALAEVFRQKRLQNGAVIIEKEEKRLRLESIDKELRVFLECEEEAKEAHFLVAEMMLLCNSALAKWAQGLHEQEAIPFIYRIQDVEVPEASQGLWKSPLEIALAVKALAPAFFSTKALRHAGIGVSAYALCTSPLRRYTDLINVAQIIHCLAHGSPKWNDAELDKLLDSLQRNVDATAGMQRNRTRYWKLLYVEQGGQDLWRPAIVTEIGNFVTVHLLDEQMNTRGKRAIFPATLLVGQAVEVRLRAEALQNTFYVLEGRV